MTPEVKRFFERHRDKINGRILEVGAYNHNGTIRDVVDVTVGIDMRPGRGVDLVCDVCDILEHYPAGYFDTVVSAETFEHIEKWREALTAIWSVLKDEGWLVLSMASLNKGRHNYPNDYWRVDQNYLSLIFPGTILEKLGTVSVGWAVQKKGPLPDLTGIKLHRV